MGKILFIQYLQNPEGGQSLSDEPYSDRTPLYNNTEYIKAFRGKNKSTIPHSTLSIEVPDEIWNADKVVVCIAEYYDGDTFGSTHGNPELIVALNPGNPNLDQHIDVLQFALENSAVQVYHENTNLDKLSKEILVTFGYDPSCPPWEGYFEGLDEVVFPYLDIVD